MTMAEHFDELHEYFAMRVSSNGFDDSEATRGLQLVCEARRLINEPTIDETSFVKLLWRIEMFPTSPGTAYFHLWSQLVEVGRAAGFAVAFDNPWRVDTNKVRCIESRAYHLTRDRRYLPLDVDFDKMQIKVLDDVQHQRWYPFTCFDQPWREARSWSTPPADLEETRALFVTGRASAPLARWIEARLRLANDDSIWLFCGHAGATWNIGARFTLHAHVVRLVAVTQSFLTAEPAITRGHKSICAFVAEDDDGRTLLREILTAQSWQWPSIAVLHALDGAP